MKPIRGPADCCEERRRVCVDAVFGWPIVGINTRMNKLARVRHAEKRIVKYQRRVWLAQLVMWPMLVIGTVAGAVWFLRSRPGSGRHEMPDLPGAHEAAPSA